MEPFIGQIIMFAGTFDIRGYASCRGQLLAISTNTALFSILGTTYGGNGTTTFALPDLQGRVAIGQGQGPGLPSYAYGQAAGSPTETLTIANMPAHNHSLSLTGTVNVSDNPAASDEPANSFLTATSADFYASSGKPGQSLGGVSVTGTVGITGSNAPFSIMPPYLTISYQIALQGIFPPRN